MIVHINIEYSSLVTADLLNRFIVSAQQRTAVFLTIQLKVTRLEGQSGLHNTYITDSSPALECPSSALSGSTALERALPSFSLHLTMVTNDSRMTETSSYWSSTASLPKASNLEAYGYKIFTIVINSLDTSVVAKHS